MSKQSIPILTLTHRLTGTVAANRFVTPAGVVTGADLNALGVTRVAGVSGEDVPVDVLGTSIVESGAAITKGDTLKSDSTGRGITWAASGARLAIALEAAGGAGEFIEVMLLPNAA
jgi:hypothetical protein